MIITKGLTRSFGKKTAVYDLNLEVPDGEVFGFIGPNGAGKTTTVRMLCCLMRPTAGEAFLDNLSITKEDEATKIRDMIGLLPEVPGLHESLTPCQILDFFGRLHGLDEPRRTKNIEELLKLLDIWDRRNDQVVTFSKGMAQKVAIARALVHEPKFIFLDEPTAALDPLMAKTVRDFIMHLKSEGKTVFITTHNLSEAERICDRVAIFNGRLVDVGTPRKLALKHFGRRTVIDLVMKAGLEEKAKGLPNILEGITGVVRATYQDNKLVVDLDDPELRNPEIIARLVAEGALIRFVSEKIYSLEEVYLKIMGRRIDEVGPGLAPATGAVQPQVTPPAPKGGAPA
jgi:ABC-2 type transport system ATP-binding protein